MEYAISARGLRKSFKLSAKQRKLERTDARVKTAVDGLSFDVAPGEIYGLLGPNGAGKTTTLRMLAALVKPDEGDALIEGVSVVDDPAGVRSLIGFLTSELKLEDVFSPDYLFDFFSELHHVDAPVRDERKRRGLIEATDLVKDRFGEAAVRFGHELRNEENTTGSSSKNPADYK